MSKEPSGPKPDSKTPPKEGPVRKGTPGKINEDGRGSEPGGKPGMDKK